MGLYLPVLQFAMRLMPSASCGRIILVAKSYSAFVLAFKVCVLGMRLNPRGKNSGKPIYQESILQAPVDVASHGEGERTHMLDRDALYL